MALQNRNATAWLLLLVFLYGVALTNSAPTGFEESMVIRQDHLVDITFIEYDNGNYDLLMINRLGVLYVVEDLEATSPTPKVVVDLRDRICSTGSRGLLGITIHPDYLQNGWVYLYYTASINGNCQGDRVNGPVNTCSRFVMDTSTKVINTTTELKLFETSPVVGEHGNGGDMSFGIDGLLYVATGDGGVGNASQSKSDLLGSIIRLTANGSIPAAGNAFTTATGYNNVARCNVKGVPGGTSSGSSTGNATDVSVCAEIFSYGLRNPFRFAMDPMSTDRVRFFINDAGETLWEEINEGGHDYLGANYGWPIREGPCVTGSTTDCAVMTPFRDPAYWYLHDPAFGGHAAVVGGAFIPATAGWPSPYNAGKYLFTDFVYGRMYLLEVATEQLCRDCMPPVSGYNNSTFDSSNQPVELLFGPYQDKQALYYTSLGQEGGVYRISAASAVPSGAPSAVPSGAPSVPSRMAMMMPLVMLAAAAKLL